MAALKGAAMEQEEAAREQRGSHEVSLFWLPVLGGAEHVGAYSPRAVGHAVVETSHPIV